MKVSKPVVAVIMFVCFSYCKKDDFSSVPSLKFLSSESYYDDFILEYEVKDKEGDLDDSIYLTKRVLNANQKNQKPMFISFVLPKIPETANLKAHIKVRLSRITDIKDNATPQDDTIVYDAYVKDKNNKKSNEVSSDTLILKKK